MFKHVKVMNLLCEGEIVMLNMLRRRVYFKCVKIPSLMMEETKVFCGKINAVSLPFSYDLESRWVLDAD